MVDVHGETPAYACEVCGDKFPSKNNLDRHRETVHEGNKKVGISVINTWEIALLVNISKNETIIRTYIFNMDFGKSK